VSRESQYVWWPAHQSSTRDLADPRHVLGHLIAISIFTVVLCLAAVANATGVSATAILVLVGIHVTWYLIGIRIGAKAASPSRSTVLIAGNLAVNIGVSVAIPLATRDPRTPLWMLPVLYACINGALQERERCITFLLGHALAPLAGLVPLLAGANLTAWGIGAPLLCAALSAVGYNHLASVSARWREIRAEQNAALAALRVEIASRDRERLIGDLNDSIGSTLSIVGLYGDMVDRHLDRPDELRVLASMVRDAARTGLGDLRGVIGAMAPASTDLGGLASTLTQAAARGGSGSGLEITVTITMGANLPVEAPSRLAIVRAFQETVRDARRERGARRFDARLAADQLTVSLEIAHDASHVPLEDRMAQRVGELGGTIVRTSTKGSGTTVRMSLPRRSVL
jgi:signal transduction histidine kinase